MRYSGEYDRVIEMLYLQGIRPAEIYRRLRAERQNPPSRATVYNVIDRFERWQKERHLTERILSEAEREFNRRLKEAHFKIVREMREREERES